MNATSSFGNYKTSFMGRFTDKNLAMLISAAPVVWRRHNNDRNR